MKTCYELYLQTYSHLNPDAVANGDYETVDFEPCDNYRDAVKRAKERSKAIPYKFRGDDIVWVQIAAYYEGEEAEEEFGTSYYLLWLETYKNGKRINRRKV